jgi:hypothetical protein
MRTTRTSFLFQKFVKITSSSQTTAPKFAPEVKIDYNSQATNNQQRMYGSIQHLYFVQGANECPTNTNSPFMKDGASRMILTSLFVRLLIYIHLNKDTMSRMWF